MKNLGIVGALTYLGLIVVMIVGWFMNIFDLIHAAGGVIDTMFVLRLVGVFVAPLGSILGLFF